MPERNKAQDLLSRAIEAGTKRDYQSSIELLTALIAEDDPPQDLLNEALLYLGRSYHAIGAYGRAIGVLSDYIGNGGDPGAGCFFLGRAYLSAGQSAEAAAALRKSIEVAGESPAAWALLGAAYLKEKKSKSAVDCLERALALSPDDKRIFRGYLNALFARSARLLQHGDADMARQMLGFVISNGLDNAATRLWRARACQELGQYQEALADCEAALASSPADPALLWMRAGLMLQSGHKDEALAEFNRLLVQYPDLPGLPQDERGFARLRASLAFNEERWKEAADTALSLLRTAPKDAPLRALAAESFRELGQTERARNHYERAIEADPNSPDLRLGLALTLWEIGDYEGAKAAAGRAGRLGAPAEEVSYYLALCDSRLGADPEKLLPALQELVRQRGAEPHLMFALGETLYRSGRPDLAGTWFDKVLALVPDHELSLLYRISVAESLEDEKGRISAYSDYLKVYPDNLQMRREYADLLMKVQDWENAAAVMEGTLAYDAGAKTKRRLALAYRSMDRWREAAIIYRDLLRADTDNTELLLSLVLCLTRDGKGDYALALLEKAPASMKKTADTSIILARLYMQRSRTEAAVDALRRATEIEPGNARAWRDLASLYRQQHLDQFADSCEERADELDPQGLTRPKSARAGAKPAAASDGSLPLKRRASAFDADTEEEGRATKGAVDGLRARRTGAARGTGSAGDAGAAPGAPATHRDKTASSLSRKPAGRKTPGGGRGGIRRS